MFEITVVPSVQTLKFKDIRSLLLDENNYSNNQTKLRISTMILPLLSLIKTDH